MVWPDNIGNSRTLYQLTSGLNMDTKTKTIQPPRQEEVVTTATKNLTAQTQQNKVLPLLGLLFGAGVVATYLAPTPSVPTLVEKVDAPEGLEYATYSDLGENIFFKINLPDGTSHTLCLGMWRGTSKKGAFIYTGKAYEIVPIFNDSGVACRTPEEWNQCFARIDIPADLAGEIARQAHALLPTDKQFPNH